MMPEVIESMLLEKDVDESLVRSFRIARQIVLREGDYDTLGCDFQIAAGIMECFDKWATHTGK